MSWNARCPGMPNVLECPVCASSLKIINVVTYATYMYVNTYLFTIREPIAHHFYCFSFKKPCSSFQKR